MRLAYILRSLLSKYLFEMDLRFSTESKTASMKENTWNHTIKTNQVHRRTAERHHYSCNTLGEKFLQLVFMKETLINAGKCPSHHINILTKV